MKKNSILILAAAAGALFLLTRGNKNEFAPGSPGQPAAAAAAAQITPTPMTTQIISFAGPYSASKTYPVGTQFRINDTYRNIVTLNHYDNTIDALIMNERTADPFVASTYMFWRSDPGHAILEVL